jgi:hypothetical protein
MRFLPLALICAATLAACGSEGAAVGPADAGLADIVVRVDDDGAKGPDAARQLTLRCETPTQSKACGAAAGVSQSDLAPPPGDRACTQIYGGPQTASISGTLRGDHVDASFKRTDGCEITRWEHMQPLLSEVR